MACTNVHKCPCSSTSCANHAKCCDCVANHAKNGDLPACLRSQGK